MLPTFPNDRFLSHLVTRDALVVGGDVDGVDEGAGVTGRDTVGHEVIIASALALGAKVDGGAAHLQVAH